jgi:hypothetical protein
VHQSLDAFEADPEASKPGVDSPSAVDAAGPLVDLL